jgi:DNA repair photolyase
MARPYQNTPPPRRGRTAAVNPPNRFERLHYEEWADSLGEDELRRIETKLFVDSSRSILARNDSPDIPFTFSLNPYRGCEHGCIYCYARPSHEHLGFSSGLDFETKIVVKRAAPTLLAAAFEKKSWEPQAVALSGNTDPYQPIERKLQITRRVLEIFEEYRNPVSVITKNHLVCRDLDILGRMAKLNLVRVAVSITSLRSDLAGRMEPRTSRPSARLDAIKKLSDAGVPVSVMVAPVIPGLNDEELPGIMREARDAGATGANYILLRLPGPVKPLFLDWLAREHPGRVDRVVGRLQNLRGVDLTDSRFGVRQRGEGEWADVLSRLAEITRQRLGLATDPPPLSTHHFRRRREQQVELF